MSRYFFHTADGTEYHDTDGTELPTHDEAWREAVQLLGALVTEDPSIVSSTHDFAVKVSDADGLLLFVVSVHSTAAPATAKALLQG